MGSQMFKEQPVDIEVIVDGGDDAQLARVQDKSLNGFLRDTMEVSIEPVKGGERGQSGDGIDPGVPVGAPLDPVKARPAASTAAPKPKTGRIQNPIARVMAEVTALKPAHTTRPLPTLRNLRPIVTVAPCARTS